MRKYGFDWLRVFVIFLLFPFHTARVFDAWEPFYAKGVVNSFSTWFVSAVSYWFMPLLFVIAGYSAYISLGKRTVREYTRERILRLLVPLLFGLVLIAPPQGYMARLAAGESIGYLRFLGEYFTNFSDLSGYTGNFSPDHLWFILYLLVIGTALISPLLWLRRHANRVGNLAKPWIMLLGFIPITLMLTLPAFGGQNMFYDAMLFFLGAVMATSEDFADILRRMRWPLLDGALATAAVKFIILATIGWQDGYTLASIGLALLNQLSAWLMILALMGLANAYLNRPSKTLNYFSRASYPVYIVHQTVLVVIAYFVVKSSLAPTEQYLVIMLGTLIVSLGIFEVCRHFKATRIVLGIK